MAMNDNSRPQVLPSNDSEAALLGLPMNLSEGEATILHSCGIGRCRPSWMQSCANIKLFTIVICILACVNGSISASYLPSVITTIERRFEFGSMVTGLVVASYEIGATVAVIFVSYLGNRRNIPVIIGLGTILVGSGTCLFALPHFVAPPYSLALNVEANNSADDSCLGVLPLSTRIQKREFCNSNGGVRSGSELYIIIFVIAQSFIGIGSTPILTLGLSYIDNHVTKKKSPQYLAFVYASATLGPVFGFGCGAALMEVYVDFMTPSVLRLPLLSTDSQWVGAWWVGFLIFGALTIIIAPPFFAFPKSLAMPEEDETSAEQLAYSVVDSDEASMTLEKKKPVLERDKVVITSSTAANKDVGSSIKKLPSALMKLLKNPVYMLLNLASVFEMVIVTGFITFVPKYLETQFGLRSSQANLYTGSLVIPGASLGIVCSGIILKKFKLTLRGSLQFSVILSVLGLACFSLAFLVGCDNTKIAGITVPYDKSVDPVDRVQLFPRNLTNLCNSDCTCIDHIYSPVCGHNSITYFSACHAGCMSKNGTLENCRCIEILDDISSPSMTSKSSLLAGQVTTGACEKDCHMLAPFMILILAISFLLAGLKTPITMVTMRCVEEDMRSFSLGIQMVIVRICALLPAPIIFGKIIDTTCLHWKRECEKRRNCLVYDVESFRYKYAGICTGLHLFGLLTFVAAWYVIRKQERLKAAISEQGHEDSRFYLNRRGECSVNSIAGTESTVVDPLESPQSPTCT